MGRIVTIVVSALVALGGAGSYVFTHDTTSTTSTSSTSTTTTTTLPLERPTPGWKVASSSARGVMVDYRDVRVGTAVFRVLRLRARTTLLRWHIGSLDPPTSPGEVPVDAGPAIFWPSEGLAGVVAVFNGGFKKAGGGGGAAVDGLTLEPMVRGYMTIAIDAAGHWSMGVWGSPSFPAPGFDAVALRQNLPPLVLHARLTPAAASKNWLQWGSPLNNVPLVARTGLGVDAKGNLVYVATMTGVSATQVGEALLRAGAVSGMELDMNPYWPIMGASFTPLHANGGTFPVQIPFAQHNPSIYETGWQRDFFVAMAEPGSWACEWKSRGLTPGVTGAQAQRLTLVGG
ncbi:MAG: hypothetical protein ACYC1I_04910, partial [Acidimicrobiales bacterium]